MRVIIYGVYDTVTQKIIKKTTSLKEVNEMLEKSEYYRLVHKHFSI